MSQETFPIQKVIELILVIGALVLIVMGLFIIFGPQIKTALGWNIANDLNVSKGGAIELYNTFLNDYKACKESSDQSCLCAINTFALPEGYKIQIENSVSQTKINLYSSDELISKEDEESGRNIIKDDAIKFPTGTPGTIGYYLTDNGRFDPSDYRAASIVLIYFSSLKSSETAMKMDG